MDSLRLDIMDAQRFDLSKRNFSRSTVNVSTPDSTFESGDYAGIMSPAGTPPNSRAPSLFSPRPHKLSRFASFLALSTNSVDTIVDPDTTNLLSSDASTDYASSTLASTLDSRDSIDATETRHTDVFAKEDGLTTTRTIIRPSPSGYFARPASPLSRPSSPAARSISPRFGALNCFGSTDAFEAELDLLEAQRAREIEGRAGIAIVVTQETDTVREERWREAIQEVLYGGLRMRRRSAVVS